MYLGFPLMFSVLILSYFGDMLINVENPWDPTNANGISIILLFWGVTAGLFIGLNRYILVNRMVPTTDDFWPIPPPIDKPIAAIITIIVPLERPSSTSFPLIKSFNISIGKPDSEAPVSDSSCMFRPTTTPR